MKIIPFNIRVNSVAPGAIDTPMLRGALEQFVLNEAEYAPQLSLLNRCGQANEIAQASLWIVSDLSSYITGTTIHAYEVILQGNYKTNADLYSL